MLTVLTWVPPAGLIELPRKPDMVWFAHPSAEIRDKVLRGELPLVYGGGSGSVIADQGHDWSWTATRFQKGGPGILKCSRAKHEGGAWLFIIWGV